jgi:hypothetical protein
VIRGVDKRGRPVRFDREYIRRGWRARAEGLATEWLGPRTEREHQLQLEREVEQQRYTTLDRAIGARAQDGLVRHADLSEVQQRRMRTLEALGFASRAPAGSWRLQPSWERTLRQMGERGDLIKQMHRAMRQVDPSRFVIGGPEMPSNPLEGERVYGRVVAVGLRDQMPDGMYAMIETVRGSGYYMPLHPAQAGQIRQGDHVVLRRWTDRSGRARLAIDSSRQPIERQVSYHGPTWLDAAQPSGSSALAAEVAKHKREREALLRKRGLWGVDLGTVERRRLAERYAQTLGLTRARRADGFVGRVVEIAETPTGQRYAVIASEREVLLMRATRKTNDLVGRAVRLVAEPVRDKSQRSRLQVEPLERER